MDAREHALIYRPGVWRCGKCNFRLVQANLNAGDGSVTARDNPGDKCQNDGGPLWRVTWRDECLEAEAMIEKLLTEGKDDAAPRAAT